MSEKYGISGDVLKTILTKAWSDPAFKAKLLANGNDALAALGIKAPQGVAIKFVEDTPTTSHFVIPSLASGELTDELAKVAAGQAVAGMLGKKAQ